MKDGYKRSIAPAADGSASDGPTRSAPTSWDGKKTSSVVEELLRNASDKAYGANGADAESFANLNVSHDG